MMIVDFISPLTRHGVILVFKTLYIIMDMRLLGGCLDLFQSAFGFVVSNVFGNTAIENNRFLCEYTDPIGKGF